MKKHLFKHFNSMEHNVFLNHVLIKLIDKKDRISTKKEKTIGGKV